MLIRQIAAEKANLESCLAQARRERLVITRRGKPVGLLVGVEGMDREQLEKLTADAKAGEEYTSGQRRIIDAQLDKAAKGPFSGPFDTADEMIAHIKRELKRRCAFQ